MIAGRKYAATTTTTTPGTEGDSGDGGESGSKPDDNDLSESNRDDVLSFAY